MAARKERDCCLAIACEQSGMAQHHGNAGSARQGIRQAHPRVREVQHVTAKRG